MAQTFDELAAQRDPLYAAMQPVGAFDSALTADKSKTECHRMRLYGLARLMRIDRDANLHNLAIRALRNETL